VLKIDKIKFLNTNQKISKQQFNLRAKKFKILNKNDKFTNLKHKNHCFSL